MRDAICSCKHLRCFTILRHDTRVCLVELVIVLVGCIDFLTGRFLGGGSPHPLTAPEPMAVSCLASIEDRRGSLNFVGA